MNYRTEKLNGRRSPPKKSRGLALFPLVLTILAGSAYAYTTLKQEAISAGCTTGGIPTGRFQIRHTPLSKVSNVTFEAIIQGEVFETQPPPVNPPFASRLTPASDFGPVAQRRFRVKLIYRLIPLNQPP